MVDKITLQKLTPLDDEEAEQLTNKLNKRLVSLFLEARTQSALYFALFRSMDARRRGVVSLDEFVDMVKIGLRFSNEKNSAIGSLWKRVDTKSSGVLPVAGFIKLMKPGWTAFQKEQMRRKKKSPDWDSACRPMPGDLWDDRTVRKMPAELCGRSKRNACRTKPPISTLLSRFVHRRLLRSALRNETLSDAALLQRCTKRNAIRTSA